MAGVEVGIKNLSKSFGSANIWSDVTLTLPAGEISALLGPSGTGKSVLLKSIIGLLKPEKGSIFIHDTDLVRCSESKLYDIRKLFGVLFQDGALFGSMSVFDNIAFPLREHTRKGESDVKNIVMEKLDMVGLTGAEDKLPGEISGGMKKRAGLARALVLDPEIILVDEPDSGLDPVRTAYLNQLLVDINTQLDATILIVTHHLGTARSMPDNIGMLFRRNLVMFGPREVLLTSEEPVVQQFLQGRRVGPIGMSEEKDTAQMEAEMAEMKKQGGSAEAEESFIDPQVDPTEGLGDRAAVQRRKDRVMQVLHTLPEKAQTAILEQLTESDQERYGISRDQDRTELIELTRNQPPEDADPFGHAASASDRTESLTGASSGDGDPNFDPEARAIAPAQPESDEPLVGVPADEDAGGTVVLPQAGEHTKSEEQKEQEQREALESAGISPDDSDGEQSGQQGSDHQGASGGDRNTGSGDAAHGADAEQSHQEPDERTSSQPTEQFPAVAGGYERGQGGGQAPAGGQDADGNPPGLGLVAMERQPQREAGGPAEPAQRSARGDARSGWATPASGDAAPGPDAAPDQLVSRQVPVDGATGAGSGAEASGAEHGGDGVLGGIRRMFRRSGS